MKRFISLLAVAAALTVTTTLAASAVPALASPLSGTSKSDGFSLASCSYLKGNVIVVDGEFVCKLASRY